ncbi:MAG: endopeptidase [Epsilonproteobacteria bacterium]|nr:endopeptidase [Campylobacterota bacterium]NPA63599.1 peptidoglycan DD-metalloendopeptidase family protein [Campylobacterota bacterium]
MVRIVWLLIVTLTLLVGDSVHKSSWPKGETLLSYFEREGVPSKLYYDLDREEKELADEIRAGVDFYEVRDNNGTLRHALIPINEELQIHLHQEAGSFGIRFIPIHYTLLSDGFMLRMEHSPYKDIVDATGNTRLAHEFVNAFKNSLDFSRSIHKGDRLAILYDQKIRLGDLFGMPRIKAAMVETGGKRHYIFHFHGRYYDERGKVLESFFLRRPLRHSRITSRFTPRRWHPVLHRYRAHLGVDFGARRGTPVMAAGSGKVIFAGRKGGYGNVIIIYHGSGYKTLYAHLSKFRRGVRAGKRVKQGQIIGYVGSTGLSTGPHLHFGLYKNNRPINPLRMVKITKGGLRGKQLKEFKKMVRRYKEQIDRILKEQRAPKRVEPLEETIVYLGGENGKS